MSLCIGDLGIADGGASALVNIGFGSGLTTPESQLVSGGWFGFCSSVPEADITVAGGATVDPDFDGDNDVDLEDFGHFQVCLTEPAFPLSDPDCFDTDLDGDSFVDQNDFHILQGCLSGANVPPDPTCDD